MRTGRTGREPRFGNEAILAGKPLPLAVRLIRLVILGRQRIRLARLAAHAVAASALILGAGGSAHATIMINNGLAPPNAANVIDDTSYQNDGVYVRNVGCPPGWPAGSAGDPCPSPGDPTEVSLADGGSVNSMGVYDSSTITVSGGNSIFSVDAWDSSTIIMSDGYGGVAGMTAHDNSTITISGGGAEEVEAYDSSIVNMSGGAFFYLAAYGSSNITMSGGYTQDWLLAYDSSTITVSGGTMADPAEPDPFILEAADSSTIMIVGNNFAVDGSPVPYGHLTALGYFLTGTLASGDSLEVTYRGGGSIILVPEPATALLLATGLAGLAAARRRRSLH